MTRRTIWATTALILVAALSTMAFLPAQEKDAANKKDAAKEPAAVKNDAAAEAPKEEPLVLKVYRVTDLLVPTPNYPYRGDRLPTTGTVRPPRRPAAAGGFGGGGGGGGGGFFQVDSSAPARGLGQFGGGDAGQGGGAGGLAAAGAAALPEEPKQAFRFSLGELIEAIIGSVDPDSWDEVGGDASIQPLGGFLLLISQTAANHRRIEVLLEEIRRQGGTMQSVNVMAYWLLLDSQQLDTLMGDGAGQGEGEARARGVAQRDAFKKLLPQTMYYRGQVACFSGQTVHIVSGTRRSVVGSVIPVVGNEPAYQPVTSIPNDGVLLQVTPNVLPADEGAILDVQSSVTRWRDPEPIPIVSSRGGNTQAKAKKRAAGQQRVLSVDRANLQAHQLATTLRVPLDEPVLVGGLSYVSDKPRETEKQLYLLVELNVR